MNFSLKPLALAAVAATCSMAAQASSSFFDLVNDVSMYSGVVTADFGTTAVIGAAGGLGDTIFSKTGGGTTATYKDGSIYTTSSGSITAAPSGSTGGFWSIGTSPDSQVGPGKVTFSANAPVKYYGFLWGSPDKYNDVIFSVFNTATNGASTVTINGAASPLPGNGDRTFSAYLNFLAGADEVITGVTFKSGRNAFETDNHSFSVTAVPEPETYAMMLAGLGLMGTIARRRKAKLTA